MTSSPATNSPIVPEGHRLVGPCKPVDNAHTGTHRHIEDRVAVRVRCISSAAQSTALTSTLTLGAVG